MSSAAKVIIRPVKLTPNDRVFEAVGTGRARLSVRIYPSVPEEVTAVLFKSQQKVTKGEVLVELDDREEKLAVQLAEVRLKDARSLLSRYEQAVKQGAVPESEVDAARADFEAAQVALAQAKLELEDRKITAPFSGVVGIPNVDPGDRVTADTLITGLDDREILYIDFEIPEDLAGFLENTQAEGHRITATTPAYKNLTFHCTITAQESRINPERRTLLARAAVKNKQDLLRPGMSFTTRWEIPGNQYPTVPEISLQWERSGSFVWLIRNSRAEKVSTRVVARKAGLVLLNGDISEGEQVVVEGLQRLRPGAEVHILGMSQR